MSLIVDLQASIFTYQTEYNEFESTRGKLPSSELSFEQQKQHIDFVYGPRMREMMAPPYTDMEVAAMETRYKFVFGPSVRHYLLRISREFCIDEFHRMLPLLEGNTNCTGDWPDVHLLESLCGGSCCQSVLHIASDTVFTFMDGPLVNVRPLYEVLARPRDDLAERKHFPTVLQYVNKSYPSELDQLLESPEWARHWESSRDFGIFRINTNVNEWYLCECAHKSRMELQRCLNN